MDIKLVKAQLMDCRQIHTMQIMSFQGLLDKYQDYDTNPGAEDLERIVQRFEQDFTTYWFITIGSKRIGALRVCDFGQWCRLNPIFILPEYQGKGYGQCAMRAAEALYPDAIRWELDTILQEKKLCHLYEKMGYRPTGKRKNIKQGMDLVFYAKNM